MNPLHSPRPMPKAVFVSPVCDKAKEKRREDLERITSGYGTQLRMNRNIQAEGLDKCAQKVRRQLRSLDRYCDGTFYLVLFISDTLLCNARLQ